MNKFVKGAAVALAITFAGAVAGTVGGTAVMQAPSLVTKGELVQGERQPLGRVVIDFAAMISAAFAGYGVGAVINRRKNAGPKFSPPTMVP